MNQVINRRNQKMAKIGQIMLIKNYAEILIIHKKSAILPFINDLRTIYGATSCWIFPECIKSDN